MESAILTRPSNLAELPLTALQTRWWFLCTAYPGGSSPLVGLVHRIRGPLDVDAWRRAIDTIVNRHEILRTLFLDRGDGPVQIVGPAEGLPLEILDLRDVPAAQREQAARDLLHDRRSLSLDLQQGPLVHSCLIQLGDEDFVWSMTIHHILSDGFSLAVIDRELAALYPACRDGSPAEVAELTVQYGDFALWQSTSDTSKEEEDRAYWREQLASVPPLELKNSLPRPAQKGAPAAEIGYVIGDDLVRAIDALARATRCSRFVVLLAALNVLLSRFSDQRDFCVGIPIAGIGRTRPELAKLVGLFNNALALRARLGDEQTFKDVLLGTRDVVFDALDHQDLPWGEVVATVQAPHEPGRAQVFQAMFLHDDVEVASRLELAGLVVEEFPLPIPRILHDIMVYARPARGGLGIRFVYDTALFTPETMAALGRDFEALLREVAEEPACPAFPAR
ncbi:condensation domain-containing protein [Rhizocola hellebori]|uniref:condensation domain-containing protein n=1 Tax=Rhizocola hellebori TaxID=1392758 RepID=UPI001941D765|nr:condensation domain-containing protein [Rhizocola hellebori]